MQRQKTGNCRRQVVPRAGAPLSRRMASTMPMSTAAKWVGLNCQFGAAAACDAGCRSGGSRAASAAGSGPAAPRFGLRASRKLYTARCSKAVAEPGPAGWVRAGSLGSCARAALAGLLFLRLYVSKRATKTQGRSAGLGVVLGPSWASQAQHGGTLALCVGLPASAARGSGGREVLLPIMARCSPLLASASSSCQLSVQTV